MDLYHKVVRDKKTDGVDSDRLVLEHTGWGNTRDNIIEYQHNSDDGKLYLHVPDLVADMGTSMLWTLPGISTLQAAQFIPLHEAAAKAYSQNYKDRKRTDGREIDFASHSDYKNPQDFVNMMHTTVAMARLGFEEVANPKPFTRERATEIFAAFMKEARLDIRTGYQESKELKSSAPELMERAESKHYSFGADNGLSFDINDRGVRLDWLDESGCAVDSEKGDLTMEGLGGALKQLFAAPEVQAQVQPDVAMRLVAEASALQAVGRMTAAETMAVGSRYHQQANGPRINPTASSLGMAEAARSINKGGEIYANHAAKLPEMTGPRATAGTLLPKHHIQAASTYRPHTTQVALGKLGM